MKPNLKKQSGFSVIEVVITLFIIGVILLLYQAALNSVFLSRNAKDQEVALRIAQHKVEELRNGGYDSLPISGSFSDSQLSTISQGSAYMTIADFNPKTKLVNVNVSWHEPNSQTNHSVELNTLITQIGGLK